MYKQNILLQQYKCDKNIGIDKDEWTIACPRTKKFIS